MMQTKPKIKTCKHCGKEFLPAQSTQKACSIPCAMALVAKAKDQKAKKAEAQDRKETRAKLDAMRTKPQLVKIAQQAFNAFIRARDADKPCICCGKPLGSEPNTFDAGHYRSVGSASNMRFVEDNVHGQTKYCNNHLAGNHVEYRKGLINRIGLERVEQIESDQTPRRYTKEALEEIARHYRAETRRLLKEKM